MDIKSESKDSKPEIIRPEQKSWVSSQEILDTKDEILGTSPEILETKLQKSRVPKSEFMGVKSEIKNESNVQSQKSRIPGQNHGFQVRIMGTKSEIIGIKSEIQSSSQKSKVHVRNPGYQVRNQAGFLAWLPVFYFVCRISGIYIYKFHTKHIQIGSFIQIDGAELSHLLSDISHLSNLFI